jgi:hypothetical protein
MNTIENNVSCQVRHQVYPKVSLQICNLIPQQIRWKVFFQVCNQVNDQVHNQVVIKTYNQLIEIYE